MVTEVRHRRITDSNTRIILQKGSLKEPLPKSERGLGWVQIQQSPYDGKNTYRDHSLLLRIVTYEGLTTLDHPNRGWTITSWTITTLEHSKSEMWTDIGNTTCNLPEHSVYTKNHIDDGTIVCRLTSIWHEGTSNFLHSWIQSGHVLFIQVPYERSWILRTQFGSLTSSVRLSMYPLLQVSWKGLLVTLYLGVYYQPFPWQLFLSKCRSPCDIRRKSSPTDTFFHKRHTQSKLPESVMSWNPCRVRLGHRWSSEKGILQVVVRLFIGTQKQISDSPLCPY